MLYRINFQEVILKAAIIKKTQKNKQRRLILLRWLTTTYYAQLRSTLIFIPSLFSCCIPYLLVSLLISKPQYAEMKHPMIRCYHS